MRHTGALEYTEREAPPQRPVRQGGGEEAQKSGGGGATGEFGEDLTGLWGTAGNSHPVQVYGTGYEFEGLKLACSGGQLKKGLEYLDADDEDTDTGGGRPNDIRFIF